MVPITNYSDVPGWSNFLHIHKNLIEYLPDDANILEIGVGFGRSTWSLLDCLKKDMKLTIVDTFDYNSFEFYQHSIDAGSKCTLNEKNAKRYSKLSKVLSQKEMFLQSIKQHKNYQNIQMIYDTSSKKYILKKHASDYDLVFMDGSHEYIDVKRELNYFKNCKLIAGHDYKNDNFPGVEMAVEEFLDNNPNKELVFYEDQILFIIYDKSLNFKLYI